MTAVKHFATASADTDDFQLPFLPDGWCWATPVELASSERHSLAIGPFGSNLKVSDYTDMGVPLVFVRNIRSGIFSGNGQKFVSQSKADELSAHTVEGGDILITKMGDPPGDAFLFPDGSPRSIITADCIKFRLSDFVGDARFFVYAINSMVVHAQILTITKGVAQQKISLSRFARVKLPVAPINEQRRIVAKIEELFSDLDAGVAALERAKANLKRYRAAVLKAAVEGKLTEAWRKGNPPKEPASKLLERILAERKKKWIADQLAKWREKKQQAGWTAKKIAEAEASERDKITAKYKEPAAPDTSNLSELPHGWCWAKLDQLLVYLRNGYFQSPSKAEKGTPILRINAVRPMSVDLSEARFLDDIKVAVDDYYIENGDLLFTRYNGSIDLLGVAGMVRRCTSKILHPDKLIRVQLAIPDTMPAFVEIAANVGESRRHMTWRARTTAGQTGISGTDVREMPIPVPSLDEQSQIITEVAEKLSLIEAANIAIDHSLLRAARLRQSILKRAFEGKLVPQDPADEPASTLERLKHGSAQDPVRQKNGRKD